MISDSNLSTTDSELALFSFCMFITSMQRLEFFLDTLFVARIVFLSVKLGWIFDDRLDRHFSPHLEFFLEDAPSPWDTIWLTADNLLSWWLVWDDLLDELLLDPGIWRELLKTSKPSDFAASLLAQSAQRSLLQRKQLYLEDKNKDNLLLEAGFIIFSEGNLAIGIALFVR